MYCRNVTLSGQLQVSDVGHFQCHPIGITVNALAPAVVRTAMVEAMNPTQVKYMTDKIPMQR